MKSIFKSVLLLGVMMMAYSCVLDKIDTQITDEEAIANIKLECDALDSYTVQATKPQAISFRISSTTPWTIEGADKVDWLTVTPASSSVSSLSEDVRITASVNETLADRTATIKVTGKNTTISKTITITQYRHGKLIVTPMADQFVKAGNTQTFSVQSNLHWEAVAADSWLTLDPASGDSDGELKTFSVKATAAANDALTRETTITVTSGDDIETFNVVQKGETLEITPAGTEISSKGGDVEIAVDATMEWNVSTSNDAFTVVKNSASKITVSAPFNNKFVARSTTITVSPVGSAYAGMEKTVDINQDCNFEVSGPHEILTDGSVKLLGNGRARIVPKESLRYVSFVVELGDRNITSNADMCCCTHNAGGSVEYECQIILSKPRARLRSNGTGTEYKSQDFTGIDAAKLQSIKTYRMDFVPDGTSDIKLELFLDGVSQGSLVTTSIYASNSEAVGTYFFGYEDTRSDADCWYVVKSCELTVISE